MFDCSPSMMLLYHRPVPAKIPKRRSRAGKLGHTLSSTVLVGGESLKDMRLTVPVCGCARVCALVSQSSTVQRAAQHTYCGLAKKRRKSVMKSDHNVIAASNGA